MKRRRFFDILILLAIFVYVIVYEMILVRYIPQYTKMITASFILFMGFVSAYLLGYKKQEWNKMCKSVLCVSCVSVLIYFVGIYGLGIFTGFIKNSNSLNIVDVVANVLPVLTIIISTELLRYILISNNRENKWYICFITFILLYLDLTLSLNFSRDYSSMELFVIITTIIIPVIVKHCVLSYLSYFVGFRQNLVYRLFIELYVFVVPVVPELGNYFISMIGVALPAFMYIFSSRKILEAQEEEIAIEEEKEPKKSIFLKWYIDIPVAIFILVLGYLISGFFTYHMIGVATNAMSPKFDKGDAVIVKKTDDPKDIKKDDVIAFYADSLIIVHRVIDVEEKDGKFIFYTKGDANKNEDNLKLTIDDIEGKVVKKIKYIAIPSVKFSELFE